MADDYINSVLDRMPLAVPRLTQIGTELRGHIAERIAAGHPMDDVLRQLGDPAALADSYLAEVPLTPAPHGRRIAAKVVDVLIFFGVLLVGFAYVWKRGDLEWVRTLSRQSSVVPTPPGTSVSGQRTQVAS